MFVKMSYYMFNRDWGINVRIIPTANRSFLTDTNFGIPGGADLELFRTSQLGDIEITGMYTGFSDDMSKGVIFGLKLPTGSYTAASRACKSIRPSASFTTTGITPGRSIR